MADTDSWEQKLAQVLEEMPEVVRYVKNHGGFSRWAFVEITDPWDAETTIRRVAVAIGPEHGTVGPQLPAERPGAQVGAGQMARYPP